MRYFIRALKYFIYVSVIMVLILLALMLLKVISTDINTVFSQGWKSVGWIALMFAGVSAVYPSFGYGKRHAEVPGQTSEIRDGVIAFMKSRNYSLEAEDGENMSFRSDSKVFRLSRTFEDRITLTRELGGYSVEGPAKDIVRIAYGLGEYLKND